MTNDAEQPDESLPARPPEQLLDMVWDHCEGTISESDRGSLKNC